MADEQIKSSPADHYYQSNQESANAENIIKMMNDLTQIIADGESPEKANAVKFEADENGELHFMLGEAGSDTPPIEAEEKELLMGDGANWATGGNWYFSEDVEPFLDGPTSRDTSEKSKMLYTELPQAGGASRGYDLSEPIVIGSPPVIKTVQKKDASGEIISEDHLVPGKCYFLLSDQAEMRVDNKSKFFISGESKIVIGDEGSIGSRGYIAPGYTYGESPIYGPYVRLGGTSSIQIDSGLNQVTPTVVMHGGMLVDISDGYGSTKYATTPARSKEVGISVPWYDSIAQKSDIGPILHMHQNASLVMDGAGYIKSDDSGILISEGNSRVQFSGNVDAVIAGGEIKIDGIPKIHIKESPIIQIRGGCNVDISGGGIFRIANGGHFLCESAGQIHYGGGGNSEFIHNGYINVTNDTSTVDGYCPHYNPSTDSGLMKIDIHAAPRVQIGGRTQIQHHGYALHRMEGVSLFQMQTKIDYKTTKPQVEAIKGPFFNFDNQQLTFSTKGCRLFPSNCVVINSGWENDASPSLIQRREPQASGFIEGNSHITINGGGAMYVEFANTSSDFAQFYYQGSSFAQYSGTQHTERHDGSNFIMRGVFHKVNEYTKELLPPWYDGHKTKDTRRDSHLGLTWGRGEITFRDAPDFELYDGSKLWMRGRWAEDNSASGLIEFKTNKHRADFENLDDVLEDEDFLAAMKAENMQFVSWHTGEKSDARITVSESGVEGMPNTCYVQGFEYKLINWNPHPVKAPDNPLIEIIEDAEIRQYGNTKFILIDKNITIDEEEYLAGLTIKIGNDSAHFSMEKLKELAGN